MVTKTIFRKANKILFPEKDITFLSKSLIFIIEFFHIIFLLHPLGVFLPVKLLKYYIIFLSTILLTWFIFDGCLVTILKNKFFGIDDTFIEFDLNLLKMFQSCLIILCLIFYKNPSISPYIFIKKNYLSK